MIRIALVYAVLDKSKLIELPHVEAALAVWDYCERSAKHIFGEMLGDHAADTILDGLKRVSPCWDDQVRDISRPVLWQRAGEHHLGRFVSGSRTLVWPSVRY